MEEIIYEANIEYLNRKNQSFRQKILEEYLVSEQTLPNSDEKYLI